MKETSKGRRKRRWEDNIRIDLREMVSTRGIILIHSGWRLLESPCECGIHHPDSISLEVGSYNFRNDYDEFCRVLMLILKEYPELF